uniref:Protein kinase domain-containing protein n=1 Tax=Oryzias latipes TaxID=8090 RepID=A0A3P9JN55_ORYLA
GNGPSWLIRGRFSVLTLCRDAETSHVFAAKITSFQSEQRQLVLREYQLLRRLHHSHLVQLHDALIAPSHVVLVEELCPGKELLHSLANMTSPKISLIHYKTVKPCNLYSAASLSGSPIPLLINASV